VLDCWNEGEGLPLELADKELLIQHLLHLEALRRWGVDGVPLTSEEDFWIEIALSNIRAELARRGSYIGPVIASSGPGLKKGRRKKNVARR